MAWTVPMTAVANVVWTAAQFNTHVRDNLNETEAAKATANNQYMVSTGVNALAARTASSTYTDNTGTTASTSWTGTLSGTPGTNPAITATTGTKALVHIAASMGNGTANAGTYLSIAISGATTITAANSTMLLANDGAALSGTVNLRAGMWRLQDGLTAGSNTFTMQYSVESGTGTFRERHLIVVPL